jgi:putative ABC transport system permease protein
VRRLRLWLVRLLLRDELAQVEREVDEEFRFHLAMKTETLVSKGMSSEEARATALRSFGNAEALRRAATRDLTGVRFKERRRSRASWLVRDLREGLRHLSRRPGFSLLAVGTLALGLSTSTAVFTYVNEYRRPFPGARADGLQQVFGWTEGDPWGALSYPDFLDIKGRAGTTFQAAAVRSGFAASARIENFTGVVFGEAVSGSFFSLLGVEMTLGRGLDASDDRPESAPAVVISHAYWAQRFGSSPDALGQAILLNNRPYVVVGVAGRDFVGSQSASRPEIWLPLEQYIPVYWARSDTRDNRDARAVEVLLRPDDGVSTARVRGELASLVRGLDASAPLEEGARDFRVYPATWISPATREAEASTTRIMTLAAACLLLLACANVANLVLFAGVRRGREMALRMAMGASRGRLLRQLLTESLLLSVAAAVVAVFAAGPAGTRLSSYFARPSVWGTFVAREIHVDPRVLLFAVAVAVVTGVLTGILPALRAARRDPRVALNAGGTWSSSRPRERRWKVPGTQDLLVSAQIALTVVLLMVAGLVMRTLGAASRVDAGFDVEQTVATYVSTSSMGVPTEERHRFFQELIRHFRELPWVTDATVAEYAPLSGQPSVQLRSDAGDATQATIAKVWPGYFGVMEMEILQGRALDVTDTVDAAGVVLVNEALATRIAGEASPVGRTLWWPGEGGAPDRGFEVVGVVRSARQTSLLDDPEPVAYFSLPQHYSAPGNALLVKVKDDPSASVDRIERALRDVDTRIAVVNTLPYSQVVRGFLYTQRMNAELFGVIAILGLILASTGVFAVVALAVARRRREIGIRVAVGASRPSVVSLVLGAVAGPVAVGLAVGGVGSYLVLDLVKRILWGVTPSDPVALTTGGSALVVAVTLAVALPVIRALRLDPVASLRAD